MKVQSVGIKSAGIIVFIVSLDWSIAKWASFIAVRVYSNLPENEHYKVNEEQK